MKRRNMFLHATFLGLISCIILCVGCANSRAAKGVEGILPAGYEALDLPQSSLPIGARWSPGFGPQGEGVPESERMRVRSVARLSSDRQLAQGVELAVAKYLGLEGRVKSSARVEVSSLTIERLASLGQVDSGTSVLYEGLKAARITVQYDAEFDASIKASASARSIPIVVSSATETRNSLTLDGTDLFIAYRVVKLERGRLRRWEKPFLVTQKIKEYELRLDTRAIQSCMCGGLSEGGGWPAVARCATEVPGVVQVVDYTRAKPDGSFYERTFEVYGHAVPPGPGVYLSPGPPPGRFSLGTTDSGDRVTSDTLVVKARFTPVLINGCIVVPDAEVELIRSRFRLRTVKSPKAPGWSE